MERFIADLVQGLNSGKIDRREFCQTVALAATVYAAGNAAQAQAQRGFKVIGINHMSYTCPDYRKARDWYASVLNMKSENTRDDGKRANLMFGPEQGKGGSFLVARSPGNIASGSAGVKPGVEAVIDHVCYTVSNWDEAMERADEAARLSRRRHRTHGHGPTSMPDLRLSELENGAAKKTRLTDKQTCSPSGLRP
jgi:catechol 2,3-dioxygenase-like lactoylglutathione lyase family enzyme